MNARAPGAARVICSASMLERARKLDPLSLGTLEVRRISREVRRSTQPPDARVAFAGNIVFDPLPEFLEAHLACHGSTAASYVAPFGQPMQELLDPASGLHKFDPNFLFLHFELDALLPGVADTHLSSADEARRTAVAEALDAVQPTVLAALEHTRATVLLTNFVGPDCYDLGIADSRVEFGEQEYFSQLNSELARHYRAEPRVQIVDLCRLMAWYGRGRARDRRMYYVAKIPWHESFLPVLADEMVRHVHAGLGRVRKCLVVDLDNTLWAGVLAEEGPRGVLVGPGDPLGQAHFDLQRRILAIKRRGVLLAACSKNNPADVEEVFRVRHDMPLRRDDFVCMEIGWGMKHEALRRIADQIGISTDSLVFLDDNPAEIELVRQLMPEVECVLLPSDAALRPTCLDRIHGLDRVTVTAEDLVKTRQYQDNAARESSRREFCDLHEYLHSLNTRISIEPASRELLARAHQLFTKTNQFNVTTRRYTLGELEQFLSDPDCSLLMVRCHDRFGELGWIGAVLLRGLDTAQVRIDSFILSCRAMGRGVETAIMNHIKATAFARTECSALAAEYLPTSKNISVREFYEEQGFNVVTVDDNGHRTYRLAAQDSQPGECSWIAVEA